MKTLRNLILVVLGCAWFCRRGRWPANHVGGRRMGCRANVALGIVTVAEERVGVEPSTVLYYSKKAIDRSSSTKIIRAKGNN